MSFQTKRIRNETPGCQHVIHFNNADAALMPEKVLGAIKGYFELEVRIGSFEVQERAAEAIERVYQSIANLIGADEDEIAIMENASRAWASAANGIDFEEGDEIIIGHSEYLNNYLTLLDICKKKATKLRIVENAPDGSISIEHLKASINDRVKLIACTHMPNDSSIVNPIQKIGQIARDNGIFYLIDASQSIGQVPLQVKDLHCDMLVASGRKFLRGPRGIAFLYLRKQIIECLEPSFIELQSLRSLQNGEFTLRDDARRFESSEIYPANKIGLGAAVDYALQLGIHQSSQRIQELASLFREQLATLELVDIYGSSQEPSAICCFTVDGFEAETLRQKLLRKHINLSVVEMQIKKNEKPKTWLRASLHYYNTEEEIDRFIEVLTELLASVSIIH